MKKLLALTILALLTVACGVPQQDYDAVAEQARVLDSDLLHCQSGLTRSQAELERETNQLSMVESELRDTSISLSELQVENDRLVALLDDAKRERSQLTYANQQLTGLMFCNGINQDWSVQSVDELLLELDNTDRWDFRSGIYDNYEIWNNSADRYFTVRATDDGEEYGFPFLMFVGSFDDNVGVFDLMDQCWVFMDIPGIPAIGTDA